MVIENDELELSGWTFVLVNVYQQRTFNIKSLFLENIEEK